jgi:hypothetical protein
MIIIHLFETFSKEQLTITIQIYCCINFSSQCIINTFIYTYYSNSKTITEMGGIINFILFPEIEASLKFLGTTFLGLSNVL